MHYRMDLSFYFQNHPGRGNLEISDNLLSQKGSRIIHVGGDVDGVGRIIEELFIDGLCLERIFITPNKLKRVSINLPEEVYNDREISILIDKFKGKRVVLSELSLYEISEEDEPREISSTKGGPQSQEEVLVTLPRVRGIYPNPARDRLTIKYQMLKEQPVTVKIYNVAGCLVQSSVTQSVSGMNNLIIPTKELCAGVYFLRFETEEYKKTEKIIVLK